MKRQIRRLAALVALIVVGCTSVPDGVNPVESFQLAKYLGRWYEIARLDHSFERGLTRVTATYSRLEDGGVRVVNRGYSEKTNEWEDAEGEAYFVEGSNRGYLKVSFSGPFYGSYIIFALDLDYQWAVVAGPDKSYLWILARTPTISEDLKASLVAKARAAGFDTSKLIWVDQSSNG